FRPLFFGTFPYHDQFGGNLALDLIKNLDHIGYALYFPEITDMGYYPFLVGGHQRSLAIRKLRTILSLVYKIGDHLYFLFYIEQFQGTLLQIFRNGSNHIGFIDAKGNGRFIKWVLAH